MKILGYEFNNNSRIGEVITDLKARGIYNKDFIISEYNQNNSELNNDAQNLIDQTPKEIILAQEIIDTCERGKD